MNKINKFMNLHCAGFQVEVAVKTLRKEHMVSNKDEFIREAKMMMSLQHHCIVRLIGLSEGESLLMVNVWISVIFV